MKKLKRIKYAWAINTNYTDIDGSYYPGFIGIYYFDCWFKYPNYILGNTVCLFKTRKSAREYKKKVNFKNAKVVKVKIIIKEI